MNTPIQGMADTSRPRPRCFGKEWDKDEAQCAGGLDPTFNDGKGGHVRKRCDFFQLCGAQVVGGAEQVIPPNNLVRPSYAPPPPYAAPPAPPVGPRVPSYAEWQQRAFSRPPPPPPTPTAPAPPPLPRGYAPAAPQYYGAPSPPQQPHYPPPPVQPHGHYPAGHYQLNYMMPGYLTEPEVRSPGESVWSVLGREILRGVGKSFGHTVSHFFDANALRRPEPPKQ